MEAKGQAIERNSSENDKQMSSLLVFNLQTGCTIEVSITASHCCQVTTYSCDHFRKLVYQELINDVNPVLPFCKLFILWGSLSLISKLGANIESDQSTRRLLYSEAGSLIRQRPGYHCTHLLYILYSVCTYGCLAKK